MITPRTCSHGHRHMAYRCACSLRRTSAASGLFSSNPLLRCGCRFLLFAGGAEKSEKVQRNQRRNLFLRQSRVHLVPPPEPAASTSNGSSTLTVYQIFRQ
ncbi:hypothetical protein AAHE18_07G014300 [Arachis hypogaea]